MVALSYSVLVFLTKPVLGPSQTVQLCSGHVFYVFFLVLLCGTIKPHQVAHYVWLPCSDDEMMMMMMVVVVVVVVMTKQVWISVFDSIMLMLPGS